jgi:hypothetical protein
MRVANYNAIGISYAAFDCGVQSTELVPEIKGAIVKAHATADWLRTFGRMIAGNQLAAYAADDV